jgi:hypothetical protein
MTHEARRAISLCVDSVMNIVHQIQGLKIPSLKAFAGKIEDNIEDDPPLDALVWKGAIAAAELQIEIEQAWQSASGRWFAVLESFHSSDERNVTDVRHVEHRECDGKMAAVSAAGRAGYRPTANNGTAQPVAGRADHSARPDAIDSNAPARRTASREGRDKHPRQDVTTCQRGCPRSPPLREHPALN